MTTAGEQRRAVTAALRRTGLGVHDLWLRCFPLGGLASPVEIDAYLHGLMPLSALDRDVVACAVNEWLADVGDPGERVGLSGDGPASGE